MPSEPRFANLRRCLEHHGWTLENVNGSHHIFKKEGERRHINVPVHNGKVKSGYVRRIEKEQGVRVE